MKKIDKALKYLETTKEHGPEMMARTFNLLFKAILPNIGIKEWEMAFFKLDLSPLYAKLAEIVADRFTEKEIEELTKISQTPVMEKYRSLLPTLNEENMRAGAEWGNEVMDELAENMVEVLEIQGTSKEEIDMVFALLTNK